MKPIIEIVVIGDEILSGKTTDTNAPYMRDALAETGFPVRFISIVGDKQSEIVHALRGATERAHIVLVTGGLGPTSDDVTVEAAAAAFGLKLIPDEEILKRIEEVFRRRNLFMSESNKKQALIPEGAEPLRNPIGTAPGVCLKVLSDASPAGFSSVIYLMPGMPLEMQAIFDSIILPRIGESYESSFFETATISVTGITESQIYDAIRHLPGAKDVFAFYPGYSGIEIKIQTNERSPLKVPELKKKVIEILGDNVFSTDGESLEQVLANMLIVKRITIGVAESCTGGLITHRLTNIPGSSSYMLCGVIAYSNESKHDILGVDQELIDTYGAVSAEVAAAMADGVRQIAGSCIGISTTGIAGPGGGSAEKPVGIMYTGISSDRGTHTKRLQFSEDRLINKMRMSQAVLDILRRYVSGCTQ